MSVLAVLTCKMLELEMAHLISQDENINRVSVLKSKDSIDFYNILRGNNKKEIHLLEELRHFSREGSGVEVLVDVLELGLHVYTKKLKLKVENMLDELQPYCDAVLMGYGLCGNALETVEKNAPAYPFPIIFPRNKDGSLVDDCLCMLLGGSSYFRQELQKEAGTWFLSYGWLRNWETLTSRDLGINDIYTLKWIFEKTGYKRVLGITTKLQDKEQFHAQTKDFAAQVGLSTEMREGTIDILQEAYELSKIYALGKDCNDNNNCTN